jgi:hypothetical protein
VCLFLFFFISAATSWPVIWTLSTTDNKWARNVRSFERGSAR